MKFLRAALAANILLGCSLDDSSEARFFGAVDENFLSRYPEVRWTDKNSIQCKSSYISRSDLTSILRDYIRVDPTFAHQTLTTTPCVFRGDVEVEGKKSRFVWYPSGHLMLVYPSGSGIDPVYYICPGSSDEDGIYDCFEPPERIVGRS